MRLISRVYLLFSTLLILALLNTALAQEKTDSPKRNSLTPGSWSLQFAIDDNFTLASFEGGNLSLKKHFSSQFAIRGGITLTGESRKSDSQDLFSSSTNDLTSKRDDDTFIVEVSAAALYYPPETVLWKYSQAS